MTDIFLVGPALIEAVEAAQRSYARWQGDARAHYKDTLIRHLVGRIGERGAEQFFAEDQGLRVLPYWRDPNKEHLCDLVVNDFRLEVKTWSDWSWKKLGRCVAVSQLPNIAKKADGIVWGIVHGEIPRTVEDTRRVNSVRVSLAGYSTIADIRRAPIRLTSVSDGEQVRNHQLDGVRDLDEFLRLVTTKRGEQISLGL